MVGGLGTGQPEEPSLVDGLSPVPRPLPAPRPAPRIDRAPLLLVRHAKAGRREAWVDDDRLRPLSPKGHRQADSLVSQLGGYPIDRILTSPYRRCLQTVAPLAGARGLPIEELPELAEGASAARTLGLLREICGQAVLACTHGDVLLLVMEQLERSDPVDFGPYYPCVKGSTWALLGIDGRFERARYLVPSC